MQLFDDPQLTSTEQLLLKHPVFQSFDSIEHIKLLMQRQAFLVWTDMVLIKALDNAVMNHDVLWYPSKFTFPAQFINRTMMEFESNESFGGCSQLEWYLEAMREVGAETCEIECLLEYVRDFKNYHVITDELDLTLKQYLHWQLNLVNSGEAHKIAALLILFRLRIQPKIYSELLINTRRRFRNLAPSFYTFLIEQTNELKEDNEVLALATLGTLCNNNQSKVNECIHVARKALEMQYMFWDGIYYQVIEHPSFVQAKVS
ncbi:MAG: DUF3050 domain-containing protein [Gammaproteobacteria bacterium]|nr:DUF3050 domain-containing protein [Gammaproteobacteria bacterium]